jgi:hypothetical protein
MEPVSFCCGQGRYAVTVNHVEGGTVVEVEARDPAFSLTVTVSGKCVGVAVEREPGQPQEARILDRDPALEACYDDVAT